MQDLLGLLTFFLEYPYWLCDQEIYCLDKDMFCLFFEDTSKSWKAILEKSDKELIIKGGRYEAPA